MPESSSLIDLLFKTVEEVGVTHTMEILNKARYEKLEFENETVRIVVETVAKKFRIPTYEIIYGSGRLNDRAYAIGFTAYYLRHHFSFDMDEVSIHLKKNPVLCHKYSKLISSLNDNFKSDLKYKNIKKELDPHFVKTKK